jgi:hypothetical protein
LDGLGSRSESGFLKEYKVRPIEKESTHAFNKPTIVEETSTLAEGIRPQRIFLMISEST